MVAHSLVRVAISHVSPHFFFDIPTCMFSFMMETTKLTFAMVKHGFNHF